MFSSYKNNLVSFLKLSLVGLSQAIAAIMFKYYELMKETWIEQYIRAFEAQYLENDKVSLSNLLF